MAKFLTGDSLSKEVYDIIFDAQKQLLIISPYIKLDDYFKKALFDRHKSNPNIEILVGFGKNEKKPERSLNKKDFEYFKDFKNISIVYIPNLHAKFYANESKGIVTSINLYDYSFQNNIEYGVLSERKILDMGTPNIDSVAFDESMRILDSNKAVFIKRPKFKKKLLIGKDFLGSEVLLDLTQELMEGKKLPMHSMADFPSLLYSGENTINERMSREDFEKNNDSINAPKEEKLLSGTMLGKTKGLKLSDVREVMLKHELVVDNEITTKGIKYGIVTKSNDKGSTWIVYPESLKRLLE
jgi:phosphatidylserine/phosphatidylglycerophosphate/cardiolipin synthase-like enzyme